MRLQFASATCPICNTYFERLPMEPDEEGEFTVLEVHPCAHAGCGKLLCPSCDQFQCDECGKTFCVEHKISIPDGTETPLLCCPACAAEAEPVLACPECSSYQVETGDNYGGTERETGYQDAGERFRCNACGAQGDAEDLVTSPVVPMAAPAEFPAPIAARSETARPEDRVSTLA